MTKYYECPYCQACPTEDEWNKFNRDAIIIFSIDPLPEGLDGGMYDCPECEQRVCGEDLLEL